MGRETSSKSFDGITDLVVVAPIRDDFIKAYENVTYATRLRIVAEGLNRIRISAREHERITPYSDVTERILTLLDFRVGIIDKDLFALPVAGSADGGPQSRRFLYLTATFDGAWEPYMRLIWKPLGPFLDLLFCNCDGYVTASEHGFDEYAQWVRDHQMDSAIFYSTTGLTVRDHLYLSRLEQVQRAQPTATSDQAIARLAMPNPEVAALAERNKAMRDVSVGKPEQYLKVHELALEVLTVFYRMADYYPPEWLVGPAGKGELSEGRYLIQVARDLLRGWEELIPTSGPLLARWNDLIVPAYRDPLAWFESGKAYLATLEAEADARRPSDPALVEAEIQGGILKPQGSRTAPMRQGALLLMTIVDAAAARAVVGALDVHYADGAGSDPADGCFRTIGFTDTGLRRIGLATGVIDHFPKEFREGMETRSGVMGDMRENHPRNWILPQRNWPPLPADADDFARARPPLTMGEVDIVLQLRTASPDPAVLMAEIARLATLAAPGVALHGYELMASDYEPDTGAFVDHFGFRDGISQPKPVAGLGDGDPRLPDQVRIGEILLGYGNDRDDDAPTPFAQEGERLPLRARDRAKSRGLQLNGSFMVIRKLEQRVETFAAFIAAETARINAAHPGLPQPMTPDRLMARMMGRYPDGRPLIATADGSLNDFDYAGDDDGATCPFAAHIRRTNPREGFQGRPAPRLLRRGMSFDHRDPATGEGARGLMFMAFNASIAEQFETIQRWINGGNSTHIASGHNDPLFGVAPKTGASNPADRVFRFVEGDQVIRVTINEAFVTLHWGLYLFVPSRTALRAFAALDGGYRTMRDVIERHGQAVIDRIEQLDADQQGLEWKRLLEDFDAKDPAERDIAPDMWAAIRGDRGGSTRIAGGVPQDSDDQPVVLAASHDHVMRVLTDWKRLSTEEQLLRIKDNSGPIYVTQQPDNRYRDRSLRGKYDYRSDAEATNAILMAYDEAAGFDAGYLAGKTVLDRARSLADASVRDYYKIELRRQYLLPALGGLCRLWYGLPDGEHMHLDGWLWQSPAARAPAGPRCPGDFLSPSRNAFYPRPGATVASFADEHGKAILAGSLGFVRKHRALDNGRHTGTVARPMFAATPDDDVLARNLIGTMVGAIPPMDGNLRGILLEWMTERTLWRHQAALRRALGDRPAAADFAAARAILYGPVSQAMCKRPAPDLLYRTATAATRLRARGGDRNKDVHVEKGDLVVASLVSAAQHSLLDKRTPDGDVSIVFGGKRRAAWQPERRDPAYPVHACPAQDMAMGAIMGIMAALLDVGRIQALPASLIVRISDWPKPTPPHG